MNRRTIRIAIIIGMTSLLISMSLVWTIGVVGSAASDKTYVGSEKCKDCHDQIFAKWRQTPHANVIQEVKKNPDAIKGDFKTPDTARTFKKNEVVMTSGLIWKQRYITKDWKILPAQWNYETQKWAPYNVDKWKEEDWRSFCGYCHTTGYDSKKLAWKELNVGCEACHGPGSKHVENKEEKNELALGEPPDIINPASLTSDQAAMVCGQCHTRGTSPDGVFPFPVDYRPGDVLSAKNFTPVPYTDTKAWWPNKTVKQHRQQYIEWRVTKHAKAGVNCSVCHDAHVTRNKFQTKTSQNNLCLGCHPQISTDAERGHAPVGGTLRQHSDCVGCHMSAVGKSAEVGDEHTHTFRFIAPIATINLGGGDVKNQPNSCSVCHAGAPVDALQADFAERMPFRSSRP